MKEALMDIKEIAYDLFILFLVLAPGVLFYGLFIYVIGLIYT